MFRSVGDGVTWQIGLWELDELNKTQNQDLAADDVKRFYQSPAASDDLKFIKSVLIVSVVSALLVSNLLNYNKPPTVARNNIFA